VEMVTAVVWSLINCGRRIRLEQQRFAGAEPAGDGAAQVGAATAPPSLSNRWQDEAMGGAEGVRPRRRLVLASGTRPDMGTRSSKVKGLDGTPRAGKFEATAVIGLGWARGSVERRPIRARFKVGHLRPFLICLRNPTRPGGRPSGWPEGRSNEK